MGWSKRQEKKFVAYRLNYELLSSTSCEIASFAVGAVARAYENQSAASIHVLRSGFERDSLPFVVERRIRIIREVAFYRQVDSVECVYEFFKSSKVNFDRVVYANTEKLSDVFCGESRSLPRMILFRIRVQRVDSLEARATERICQVSWN